MPDPAERHRFPPVGMTVEVVDAPSRFSALRGEWDEAVAASPGASIFSTWEWLSTWWRHFGETTGSELHVVTVRDEVGLAGIAPMVGCRIGRGPLRVPLLRPMSHDAGDYGGFTIVRRHDEVADALLGHFGDVLRSGLRAVVLSRLPTDSLVFDALTTQLVGGPLGVDRQAVDVCLHADARADDFDLDARRRKARVRQRLERLHEAHRVDLRAYTGVTLAAGLEQFVHLHRQRWEGSPTPERGLLSDDERRQFLLDACRALDECGRLRLSALVADGEVIAGDLDFVLGRRLFMFKTAFDVGFGRYAPGHLLVSEVIERGMGEGLDEFDFMRGDHPYKRMWTNRVRHLVTFRLTRRGLSGQVASARARAAQAYDQRTRL